MVVLRNPLQVLTYLRLTFLMPKNKNKENKKYTKTKKALLQRGLNGHDSKHMYNVVTIYFTVS